MSANPKTVILVVDDEESIIILLRDALREFKYDVVLAHNGKEALEELRKNPPDLVLLDVMMPEIS